MHIEMCHLLSTDLVFTIWINAHFDCCYAWNGWTIPVFFCFRLLQIMYNILDLINSLLLSCFTFLRYFSYLPGSHWFTFFTTVRKPICSSWKLNQHRISLKLLWPWRTKHVQQKHKRDWRFSKMQYKSKYISKYWGNRHNSTSPMLANEGASPHSICGQVIVLKGHLT